MNRIDRELTLWLVSYMKCIIEYDICYDTMKQNCQSKINDKFFIHFLIRGFFWQCIGMIKNKNYSKINYSIMQTFLDPCNWTCSSKFAKVRRFLRKSKNNPTTIFWPVPRSWDRFWSPSIGENIHYTLVLRFRHLFIYS